MSPDLINLLIDALIDLRLLLSGLLGRQPARGYGLVDALVCSVLERGGHIVGGLAMGRGDLRQRLAVEFRAQLLGWDADGRCRGIQAHAEPPAARATALAFATWETRTSRQAGVGAG